MVAKLSSNRQFKLNTLDEILAEEDIQLVSEAEDIDRFKHEMIKINDVDLRNKLESIYSNIEVFNSVKLSLSAAEAEKFKVLMMKTVLLLDDYSMQWIQVSKNVLFY